MPIQIEETYLYSPDTQKKYNLEQGPGIGNNMPNSQLQLVIKMVNDFSGTLTYGINIFADSLQGQKIQTISNGFDLK